MSDTTPSPDDARDELVSAVLDGEADADERARVETDPALRSRLEELRAVRDMVAAPVAPLDDVTALRLRRTATAAAPVADPAAPRRAARAGRWIGSVAAVVLLAIAAIPVLGALDDGGSGDDEAADTMSGADDAALESAESGDAGDADELVPYASEEADGGAGSVPDLGEFTSDAELGRSVLAARADMMNSGTDDVVDEDTSGGAGGETEIAPSSRSVDDAVDACPPPPGDGAITGVFAGRVDGELRVVWLVELDGSTSAQVVDPATCAVVAEVP